MTTTLDRLSTGVGVPRTKSTRVTLTTVLLSCGVAYSILYIVASDVIAATLYHGYNRIDQAISELSATSAPTKGFLTAMLFVYAGLMVAFGVGVWRAAGGQRALRVTGAVLVVWGATGLAWLPFPMTSREDMLTATTSANDVGHTVLSAWTGVLVLAAIGFASSSLGRRFRVYSYATAAVILVFSVLTSTLATKLKTGTEPTPRMGLYERTFFWAWLMWMAVLAVALLRRRKGPARGRARPHPAAALGSWLGTSTWPAYGAAALTAAYGLLKAYWVFGGTALWSIAPLSQEMIDKVRSGTAPTWFVVADAVSVGLAVVGVLFALSTLRPRRWLPVWLVRSCLWPLAAFMVLRGVLGIVGDVQQIASGASGPLTHTAIWDLALWAPMFLIWGLLWAATASTYARRARTQLGGES